MALLYHEQQFIEHILTLGDECKALDEVKQELETFQKKGQLKYLFYVYRFCLNLQKHNILFMVTYNDQPSKMMEYFGLSNIIYFSDDLVVQKYGRNKKDTFQIIIPSKTKEEVITLFKQIIPCHITKNNPGALIFDEKPEFCLEITQNHYLYQLSKFPVEFTSQINQIDHDVIQWMLKDDEVGYYLPNLYGVVFSQTNVFFDLFHAAHPKTLKEFNRLITFLGGMVNNRNIQIKQIKEQGLDKMICSCEELYQVLCDSYDVPKEQVDAIFTQLVRVHHLSEGDELVLRSNEVPEDIIEQLNNITYLPYAVHSIISTDIIYKLMYLKFYYRHEFELTMMVPSNDGEVGPFFYINGEIIGHRESVGNFDVNLRFFDSVMSHLKYFDILHIDGDYGNYPRGRVILDRLNNVYLVYIDQSLLAIDIEKQIIDQYHLEKECVVWKYDEHYTHDDLE